MDAASAAIAAACIVSWTRSGGVSGLNFIIIIVVILRCIQRARGDAVKAGFAGKRFTVESAEANFKEAPEDFSLEVPRGLRVDGGKVGGRAAIADSRVTLDDLPKLHETCVKASKAYLEMRDAIRKAEAEGR